METYQVNTGGGLLMSLIYLALIVVSIAAMWKLFEKAGEAGWKSIIPIYNAYILFKLAGRNGWGILLMLIPIVNIVIWIMVAIDLAKHFGKSTAFGVLGLVLFPFVGYLMLGFGEAKYVGPKHA